MAHEDERPLAEVWAAPTEVSDVDLAFPARGGELSPGYEALRSERIEPKWVDFQSRWFHPGLPPETAFVPRAGVDAERAWRHLSVVQSTFETKHEHKMLAVAWLAQLWFEDVLYPEEKR